MMRIGNLVIFFLQKKIDEILPLLLPSTILWNREFQSITTPGVSQAPGVSII
jgi:hypothetical protein